MLRVARPVGWVALPVGLMLVQPSGAAAQGTPEQRRACAPDAIRLCSDFIPDVEKITACMKAKYKVLSDECRAAMKRKHPRHHRQKKQDCVGWGCIGNS
jgi:hypothetical protein